MILGPLPGLRAGRGTLDDYLDGVTIHRLCTLPFASISQKVVWFTLLRFQPEMDRTHFGFFPRDQKCSYPIRIFAGHQQIRRTSVLLFCFLFFHQDQAGVF
jgi:hypothetical protein